jgi:hypothetical protein
MNSTRQVKADLLEAIGRELSEDGYEMIFEPSLSLVPESVRSRSLRPDAIAIGRSPKLLIEVASGRPADAKRIAEIQRLLSAEPGWKLHLIVDRASSNISDLAKIPLAEILPMLSRAVEVATVDSRAALMLCWATLEALVRDQQPGDFSRPQTPSRIVERLATEGAVTATQAKFLRTMAEKRNAFIHGDLRQSVRTEEIKRFVDVLQYLIATAPTRFRSGVLASGDES